MTDTEKKNTLSGSLEKARKILSTYHGPKIRIMEVCGTHTHEIFRLGIRSLLSEDITLISGPGWKRDARS